MFYFFQPLPFRHCERSEVIQSPEYQIWGSVLPFRPPRVSNLGAFSSFRQLGSQIWGSSFPSPINFTPRSSQNQQAKANPLIYFLPSQEATTGSPRRNEVEIKRSWHEVPEGLSGSREGNSEGSGNLVPLPRLLFTFKLRSLL